LQGVSRRGIEWFGNDFQIDELFVHRTPETLPGMALDPYPFAEPSISFQFPARHAKGKHFSSANEFQDAFKAAPVEMLSVTVRTG
jgi:hypothetical protein